MDSILDTVPVSHPLDTVTSLLKRAGKLVMVGVPTEPLNLPTFNIVFSE